MAPEMLMDAFGAESGLLSQVAAGTDDAAFARPSPCLPWTVAELLFHVRMTMARLSVMLCHAGTRCGPAKPARLSYPPPPASGGRVRA